MKNILHILFLALLFGACQKEEITLGPNSDDTFYLQYDGISMRVLVRGNTSSKAFLILVHGGPGASGYVYDTPKMAEIVQSECAVVFYDQRNAGASQGNRNVAKDNLEQYADDLRELISVLKLRYGQDIGIYLMSKSFGGMVASAFMTKENNQDLVKGWLFVNASHNYGLNDSLTYQMLLGASQEHISGGKKTEEWQPIFDYCKNNPPGPFTARQSFKLNMFGWKAQKIIEGMEPYNYTVIHDNAISENIPLTSYYLGRTNAGPRSFNASLTNIKFSSQLKKVTLPVLVCAGKLDFVCPQGLADDFMANVGSVDKKKLLFEKSAHRFEEQEAYYNAFVNFIQRIELGRLDRLDAF